MERLHQAEQGDLELTAIKNNFFFFLWLPIMFIEMTAYVIKKQVEPNFKNLKLLLLAITIPYIMVLCRMVSEIIQTLGQNWTHISENHLSPEKTS